LLFRYKTGQREKRIIQQRLNQTLHQTGSDTKNNHTDNRNQQHQQQHHQQQQQQAEWTVKLNVCPTTLDIYPEVVKRIGTFWFSNESKFTTTQQNLSQPTHALHPHLANNHEQRESFCFFCVFVFFWPYL